MKPFIYCRVQPHNGAVAKSDRLQAQEKRVTDFLKHCRIDGGCIYRDQGEVHPVHLLPGLQKMLDAIPLEECRVVVFSDHPARLGRTSEIQNHVRALIRDAGSHFVWADIDRKNRLENLWETCLKSGDIE